MRCYESGIGIEAGVWSVEDAERLATAGIEVLRVLRGAHGPLAGRGHP